MVLRVLQALAGALLAAGGGYFAWINRGSVDGMFPPEPGLSVWTFVAGLVGSIVGAVAIVHAIGPRPKAKARQIEEAEKRARVLKQAEQFYTAQAEGLGGAAEGEPLFPEGLRPGGTPGQPISSPTAPEGAQPPEPFRLHSLSQPPTGRAPVQPPPPEPSAAMPAPEPRSASDTPQPNVEPPASPRTAPTASTSSRDPETPVSAQPFPAPVASRVIPRATEPPPATPSQATTASAPAPASAGVDASASLRANGGDEDPALDDIRTAIAQNRLEDADRLLATTRKRLSDGDGSHAVELAQLTGLAGDHAAADGRLGSAKWLWRLALQRFAAAGAIDSPAARDVSERMRLADQ